MCLLGLVDVRPSLGRGTDSDRPVARRPCGTAGSLGRLWTAGGSAAGRGQPLAHLVVRRQLGPHRRDDELVGDLGDRRRAADGRPSAPATGRSPRPGAGTAATAGSRARSRRGASRSAPGSRPTSGVDGSVDAEVAVGRRARRARRRRPARRAAAATAAPAPARPRPGPGRHRGRCAASAESSRSLRSGSRETEARRTDSAHGRASGADTSSATARTSLSTLARCTWVGPGTDVRPRPVYCLPVLAEVEVEPLERVGPEPRQPGGDRPAGGPVGAHPGGRLDGADDGRARRRRRRGRRRARRSAPSTARGWVLVPLASLQPRRGLADVGLEPRPGDLLGPRPGARSRRGARRCPRPVRALVASTGTPMQAVGVDAGGVRRPSSTRAGRPAPRRCG